MSRSGFGERVVAAVSAQTLRVVGALTMVLSVVVAAASVSTEYGLAVAAETGGKTATYAADAGIAAALVEFAVAHPAYPAAVLVGLVLVVAGEDTPLIGG